MKKENLVYFIIWVLGIVAFYARTLIDPRISIWGVAVLSICWTLGYATVNLVQHRK
jgi:hypothetical protein